MKLAVKDVKASLSGVFEVRHPFCYREAVAPLANSESRTYGKDLLTRTTRGTFML